MNAKFYVPFETAKMLREAGYPQSGSDMYYDLSGNLTPDNGFLPIDDDVCPAAPAYCEVLDWLAGKEIYIDVDKTTERVVKTRLWHCYIWCADELIKGAMITASYSTREEAINSAIIKALEELL